MRDISHNERIEPPLLEVSTQEIPDLPKSAIKGDEARADFGANGFWQWASFDVKVCNLLAPSYRNKSWVNTLSPMEKDKKRKYNTRIQQIERGTFTPLIFGATGGVAREFSIFLRRLAEKTKETKANIISAIRGKINFTLLRSVVTCLRGDRRPSFRSFTDKQLLCEEVKIDRERQKIFPNY